MTEKNGFQQLNPDRAFASVPYALTAGDVSDSSISLNRLSPEVLGALNILPSISTQPFARYDRSNGSAQLEVFFCSRAQPILPVAQERSVSQWSKHTHTANNQRRFGRK